MIALTIAVLFGMYLAFLSAQTETEVLSAQPEARSLSTFEFGVPYARIQGQEAGFLDACTKAINGSATCIFVYPGSTVVGVEHFGEEGAAAIRHIQNHGLISPFFPAPLIPVRTGN